MHHCLATSSRLRGPLYALLTWYWQLSGFASEGGGMDLCSIQPDDRVQRNTYICSTLLQCWQTRCFRSRFSTYQNNEVVALAQYWLEPVWFAPKCKNSAFKECLSGNAVMHAVLVSFGAVIWSSQVPALWCVTSYKIASASLGGLDGRAWRSRASVTFASMWPAKQSSR